MIKTHLGVEIETCLIRAMGRVGLDEFVIEEESWLRNKVEQFVGVRDVGDLEKFGDEEFGEIDAVAKGVGMDLFQLVHNRSV